MEPVENIVVMEAIEHKAERMEPEQHKVANKPADYIEPMGPDMVGHKPPAELVQHMALNNPEPVENMALLTNNIDLVGSLATVPDSSAVAHMQAAQHSHNPAETHKVDCTDYNKNNRMVDNSR